VKEEYKRGRIAETMSWSSPGEEAAARVIIESKDEAKEYAEKWSEEEHANAHTWWTDGSQSDDRREGSADLCGDGEGDWKVLPSYLRK
jgi:hypothetical protein